MKDIVKSLNINGVNYPLIFNLNVMQTIQEHYGSLDAWGDLTEAKTEPDEEGNAKLTKEPDAKAVIFGFTEMINEGIDIENEQRGEMRPYVTYKQVGRLLTDYGLAKANLLLNQTVIESTENPEKNV